MSDIQGDQSAESVRVTVDLDALRLVLDYVNRCECRGPFGEAMDDAMDRLEAALNDGEADGR